MDGGALISVASIAKRLASCSTAARRRAVRALAVWLPGQPDSAVSDDDLLRIWKGLFYCVWHADKLPAQLDIANRLAGLLDALPPPFAARYFEAYLVTVRREWGGIDFLRLDKFYLLMRKFLCHVFLFLKKNLWDLGLTARLTGALEEKSFFAADKFPANGVNYHIAEVFLDELKDFLPLAAESLELLLKPSISVLEKSADKVLVNKTKVNVFDRLLESGGELLSLKKAGDQVESGSEVDKFGNVAFVLRLSTRFFNSASASDTLQGNRKVLFGLHEGFLKLENDLEKSGVDIFVQHSVNGSSEKAINGIVSDGTEQVEVAMGTDVGGSENTLIKKRKKSKKASDSREQKSKSKKKKTLDSSTQSVAVQNSSEVNNVITDASLNGDATETDDLINFDECVISNLQKQFEKAAAEAGMTNDNDSLSTPLTTPVASASSKKRRREKSANGTVGDSGTNSNGGNSVGKSGEKSVKKVTFSMKNNLVWKPHNPLPPQSLRLPPSATPRGSALKKGVPPGPIRETPPTVKKIKVKANSAKKSKKGVKGPSSAIKRLRKLQSSV